jgi:hypothetical protein
MKYIPFIVLLVLALPFVFADLDNFFSVKENSGPYTVMPGDNLVVDFIIDNRDEVYPRNVTVYIDPCPIDWKCEDKTVSYMDTGLHAENLTLRIPDTASPKRYTVYILLKSEWQTRRGTDRVIIDVLTEKDAETISVAEYRAQQEADKGGSITEEIEPVVTAAAEVKEVKKEEPVKEVIAAPVVENQTEVNTTDIKANVERLETSSQFMEYVSVILVVVLIFVGVGAYMSWKKK